MGMANFGRHLAQWVYSHELLKVALLLPFVTEKDLKAKSSAVNQQQKQTKQRLHWINLCFVLALAFCQILHLTSSSLLSVIVTYIPWLVQIGTLMYSLTAMRRQILHLCEQTETFMLNDKLICCVLFFSTMAFVASAFAMLWTFNVKSLPWDSESPGK